MDVVQNVSQGQAAAVAEALLAHTNMNNTGHFGLRLTPSVKALMSIAVLACPRNAARRIDNRRVDLFF